MDPLGLEPDDFVPPNQPAPAEVDLEVEYEAPPRELIEWDAEKAGAILRGGGFLLHTADPLSREDGGEELWRMTEADLDAMAPPLARIANRYEPARRLAGVADEGELAFGMIAYARQNLIERGKLATEKKRRLEGTDPIAPMFTGPGAPPLPSEE